MDGSSSGSFDILTARAASSDSPTVRMSLSQRHDERPRRNFKPGNRPSRTVSTSLIMHRYKGQIIKEGEREGTDISASISINHSIQSRAWECDNAAQHDINYF
jgi:hypothetical protein